MKKYLGGLFLVLGLVSVAHADFDTGVSYFKLNHYADAYAEFKPIAESGDTAAQFNLGLICELGSSDWPKNPVEAIKWYSLSGERGYGKAQLRLGSGYVDGNRGWPADYKKAFYWFNKALRSDSIEVRANAETYLGYMYLEGYGTNKDVERARGYLEAANPNTTYQGWSNYLLGLLYGRERKSYNIAVHYYRLAAENKSAAALFELGNIYLEDRTGEPPIKADKAKAFKYFSEAVDLGYDPAKNSLGDMLYAGDGVNKDLVQAAEWYKKTADKGNVYGSFHLAKMYLAGEGVAKNDKAAFDLLSQAAQKAIYRDLRTLLADLYYSGRGTPVDKEKAFSLYEKAAIDGNYAEAQYKLANMYFSGEGTEADYSKALDFYQKAAAQNYPDAASKIPEAQKKVDEEQAALEADRKVAAKEQAERDAKDKKEAEAADKKRVNAEKARIAKLNKMGPGDLFALADKKQKEGDRDSAIEALCLLVSKYPNSPLVGIAAQQLTNIKPLSDAEKANLKEKSSNKE